MIAKFFSHHEKNQRKAQGLMKRKQDNLQIEHFK